MDGVKTTSEEMQEVFDSCKLIIDAREDLYGKRWENESLDELWSNISRKFHGIEYMRTNGHPTPVELAHHLKDLVNYTAFYVKRQETVWTEQLGSKE